MEALKRYRELTITLPEAVMEDVTAKLMELGCLGTIERSDAIVAYFESSCDTSGVEREVRKVLSSHGLKALDGKMGIQQAFVPDEDWNRNWKAGFKPLDVGGRFTILPPWEERTPGRINLIIDPGMAFGTGHHETTRSCLLLMERYADRVAKKRFLDLGTGTGLLAIAAVRLGFVRVIAADTDPLAIEAARRNISLNDVSGIEVVSGGISELRETFDVIAANLISGVLIELAPDIAGRLAPGGIAILSGILIGQENEVIEAMKAAGLSDREKLVDGKWVSLVMERVGS